MMLLLTNDDGYTGEGLRVLAGRLSKEHEVWIVAPDRNRSGVSQCISMNSRLKLTKVAEREYMYEGTPADCAILATRDAGQILPCRPDAVISGINRGANLGTDILYSGTAAAARQAVLNGIPGVALSIDSNDDSFHYDALADFAAKNIQALISLCRVAPNARMPAGPCIFTNVNALTSVSAYKGIRMTGISFREYADTILVDGQDEKSKYCSAVGTGKINTNGRSYHDYEAVASGFISVSRVFAEPQSAGIVDGIQFSL